MTRGVAGHIDCKGLALRMGNVATLVVNNTQIIGPIVANQCLGS